MKPMTRVSAVQAQVRASQDTGASKDAYIPSGCIPDVLRGGHRTMRDGCYSFADILDLASHHLVWIGEAQAVEARLRGGAVTVRAFLRERYGVMAGKSDRDDLSDLRRFRLWLADARRRVRWLTSGPASS